MRALSFLGSCVQGYQFSTDRVAKVYRQTDPVFINVLDRIRNNAARKQELDTLNGRYFPSFEPQNEDMYITLATRRDQVDFINEKKLAELPGEEYVSVGKIEGIFRNPHYLPS